MAPDLDDIKTKITADEYAAFKELYLLTYAPLIRFACIYTHDSQMAEDVLSDVFLKIWNQRAELTKVNNLRVYLFTSVKNTAINYRNRQSKIVSGADELHEMPAEYPDPENALISSEISKKIRMAVNDLPPRCKLIFQLAKEQGLRYKEISSILGISVKTIDSQLSIAIARIGNSLVEEVKG